VVAALESASAPKRPSVPAIIGVDARFLARLHKSPLQPLLHAHSFTIRHYRLHLPSSSPGPISGPVHAPPVASISVAHRSSRRQLWSALRQPHRLLQRERADLRRCPRQITRLLSVWLCIAPVACHFVCAGNLRAHPQSTWTSRRFAAVLLPGSIRRQRPTRILTAVGAGPDAFGSRPPSACFVDRDPPHLLVPTTAAATP
jgi:hypothetical protein